MFAIGIVNCAVLGITCCAVIWYCIETRKLRTVSQLDIRLNGLNNNINNLAAFLSGRKNGEFKRLCFAPIKIISKKIKDEEDLLDSAETEENIKDIETHQDNLDAFEELKEYRLERDKIIEKIKSRNL